MSARRPAFPLLPVRRVAGTPFGERRSSRRGRGSEVAGARPYLPGDPSSTIDWYASARVSSARGSDEFVVREFYRDEAPRVLIVSDRRPSMAFYGPDLPWLQKNAAVIAAAEAIVLAAAAARAELGLADVADGHTRVLPPGATAPRHVLDRVRRTPFDAPPASLAGTLAQLLRRGAELPEGSFVFVLSDFLARVPETTWTRLRSARLDVVPVIVQDPTWEQSFPLAHGVEIPFVGQDGRRAIVRLSAREAATRRRANEERLAGRVRRFGALGFDPVVLGRADARAVDAAFLRWAERRRIRRRRR